MQFSSLSTISSSVSSNGCGVVTGGYTVTYSEIAPQITGNVRPDLEKVLFYKRPTAQLEDRPLAEYECQQFCDEDTRPLQPEVFTSGQGTVLSGAAFNGKCSSTSFSSVITSTTLLTSTSVPDPMTTSSSLEAGSSTQSMEITTPATPTSDSVPATCTPAPAATTGAYTFQFAEVLKPSPSAGVNYTLDFGWALGVVSGTTNINLPETA
ncbi:hypothetical protein IFR04_010206 [Cadophora malorum]|uniref:Uncharacterized protein n=1 Tax=Cadophora malorum TaxID=108018 RepID=A0A8H7TD83_9HELO|nr:hypothetical protein IFR04_010206 [Cadophora malorum]